MLLFSLMEGTTMNLATICKDFQMLDYRYVYDGPYVRTSFIVKHKTTKEYEVHVLVQVVNSMMQVQILVSKYNFETETQPKVVYELEKYIRSPSLEADIRQELVKKLAVWIVKSLTGTEPDSDITLNFYSDKVEFGYEE